MTQAVNNNILNNLEQMLSNTTKSISKPAENVVSAMDKTPIFKNVLETKLDKEPTSISDLKNNALDGEDSVNLTNFKEILKQATDEANVETSLDLTLARDITEIISQLKTAVENTTETIEDVTETIEDASEEPTIDELLEMEDSEILEEDNSTIESEKEISTTEPQMSFEQVLTIVDKIPETKIDFEQNTNSVEDDSSIIDSFQTVANEVVEFAENIVEEVVSTKQTVDENIGNNIESILDEEMLKDLKIESLSAETDTSGGETLMQNQTPEEYAVKAMIHVEPESFDIKLNSTQNVQNSQQVQVKPMEVTPDKLIDQISKHIENLHNGSKVNIVLNPESLGKVNIQLLSTKEGLTAQFTVTTQEAKDMLTKGLDSLKDTLASQGVGVENVSVKIAEGQKSEYNQDWTEQEGSKGGNKRQQQPNREEKDKGLFEKMMAQTTDDENGNV